MRLLSLMLGALISLSCCLPAFAQRLGEFTSEKASFQVVVIATGLDHPWSIAFLPEGDFLVTERSGALRLIRKGRLQDQPIVGLPEISAKRDQGGLLDIALDPAFDQNGRLCLSYVAQAEGGRGTEIGCGIFHDDRLDEFKVIFRALPKNKSGRHFGCRLLFADGYLYATLGDRGNRPQAQDRGTHPGSVVRLMADGTVPADNPFIGHSAHQPEL